MEIKRNGYSGVAIPFVGSVEQSEYNFATHSFDGEEGRCMFCDCRPWGVWANQPCGNANMERVSRYRLADGSSVWVKTRVINGQEYFVGVWDDPEAGQS